MTQKIRIGLVGYGNIGRGVELAINQFPDMEGVAVFTRRNPAEVKSMLPAVKIENILEYKKCYRCFNFMWWISYGLT